MRLSIICCFIAIIGVSQTAVSNEKTCLLSVPTTLLNDDATEILPLAALEDELKQCTEALTGMPLPYKTQLLKRVNTSYELLDQREKSLENLIAISVEGENSTALSTSAKTQLEQIIELKKGLFERKIEEAESYLSSRQIVGTALKTCLDIYNPPSIDQSPVDNHQSIPEHLTKCGFSGESSDYSNVKSDKELDQKMADLENFRKEFVKKRLEELQQAMDDQAEGDDANRSAFELAIANTKKALTQANKSLVAGRDITLSNTAPVNSETDCNGVMPTITIGSIQVDEYRSQVEAYVMSCEGIFRETIEKNTPGGLTELKNKIEESIKNINTSTQIIGAAVKNSFSTGIISGSPSEIVNFGIFAGNTIEKLETFIEKRTPIIANWRSDAISHQFYLGLDLASTEGFKETATPRGGLLIYFRPDKKLQRIRSKVHDCYQNKEDEYWGCPRQWSITPHWYFKGDYSSSGEVSATSDGDDEQSVDAAMMWESGIFLPLLYVPRSGTDDITGIQNPLKFEFMLGPLYARGARKPDEGNFVNRYYRGLRLAFNEETYFDLLYGYTEGIKGADGNLNKRWEIRGQLPVTRFGVGRLFVGGNINFGRDDKDISDDQRRDSYNIYVTWQTSFDDLWKGGLPE